MIIISFFIWGGGGGSGSPYVEPKVTKFVGQYDLHVITKPTYNACITSEFVWLSGGGGRGGGGLGGRPFNYHVHKEMSADVAA